MLFLYHDLVDGELRWELFAVGATFVVIKLAVLLWLRVKD